MSKLFEALQNAQAEIKPTSDPLPLQVPDLSDDAILDSIDADQLPVFTNYDIDEMVEYLLASYESSPGETFGILPVGPSDSAAAIVLETFMYLAVNCEVPASLCDLASNRPMLNYLRAAHAFDNGQTIPRGKTLVKLSVLNKLFDYVLVSRDPAKGSASRRQLAVDLLKFTRSSELSMFLFPSIASFNPFCVQMARRVDKLILLGGENQSEAVARTGDFLHNLGVNAHGVYLLN
ncbi:MAG: hypothetical protein KTR32_25280 [Granulosicoccus sp.]|nr:hypothetical protein [Granulosicoccus sp.]